MKKCITWMMILLILTTLNGCKKEETNVPELKEPVTVQMDSEEAKVSEIYNMSVYKGEIKPYVEELSFSADGTLKEIHVEVGDYVQKGQVLATLDQSKITSIIENLENEIVKIVKEGDFHDRMAEVDIAIAQEELEVMKESAANTNMYHTMEYELQQMKLHLKQTKELRELELQNKRDTLTSLKEEQVNNQIVAPFSGRIVHLNSAKIGSSVKRSSSFIYIADETKVSLVTPYIYHSIITEAQLIYAKIGNKNYEITYIPSEESAYGTKYSEFKIHAQSEEIKSGQLVTLVLVEFYKEDVLTVPLNAVFKDAEGQFVYKIENNQQIRCNITAGLTSNTKVEIVEGLQEGDVVYVKP